MAHVIYEWNRGEDKPTCFQIFVQGNMFKRASSDIVSLRFFIDDFGVKVCTVITEVFNHETKERDRKLLDTYYDCTLVTKEC